MQRKKRSAKMFGSRLAGAPQHYQQVRGRWIRAQRFLNELGNPVLHAHARAQIVHQHRTFLQQQFHPVAYGVDCLIILGLAGLLAQTHESRAQQTLQFWIFLDAQLLAYLLDGLAHRFAAQPGIKVGQLAQPNRRLAARFLILVYQAARVVVQNFG